MITSVAVIAVSSCMTTHYDGQYSHPETENSYFQDGNEVYVLEGDDAIIEYQLLDYRGYPQISFNIYNKSNRPINFIPSDFKLIFSLPDGRVYTFVGADDKNRYAADFAEATVKKQKAENVPVHYLSGNSYQVYAYNQIEQAQSEAMKNNAQMQLDSVRSAQKEGVVSDITSYLVGKTTIKPGSTLQGGVGFVNTSDRAYIGPKSPVVMGAESGEYVKIDLNVGDSVINTMETVLELGIGNDHHEVILDTSVSEKSRDLFNGDFYQTIGILSMLGIVGIGTAIGLASIGY